jgi:molybdate transport system substrate-binding protein
MVRFLLAALALAACGNASRSSDQIRIAMASDLALAFEEVGREFKKREGVDVILSPGSSGLLAKQIDEGLPVDLFAAADVSFVEQVIRSGACDGDTQALYGRGRIVMWSNRQAPARLEDLTDPRYAKIGIANPQHAPYGRAAQQALEKVGVWDQIQGKLVRGGNILETMTYAKRGEVDVAIVALSLSTVEQGGSSTPIDPTLHAPLDQALVVCGDGPGVPAAKKFAAFLASPEGRDIMNRYGFIVPEG